MDNPGIKYWLALTRVKGLQLLTLRGLMERFGGPEGLFGERRGAIAAFSPALADGVAGFDGWGWVDNEIELIAGAGARAVAFDDPAYPAQLREICDPPCLLYVKGTLPDKDKPVVAVVGTRQPTHYGLRLSEAVSRGLAARGAVVASGMARGCDTAAHKGALASGGETVAVLGTGVDVPYPRENAKLYEEIALKGAVISELPMSTPPAPYNFPKRNRIISGLALAVVVAEAPMRSGALQTARLALDYNREVMAVPGQAGSIKSMGTNKLLKDGATIVESAEDVLAALSLTFTVREVTGGPELGPEEARIMSAIGEAAVHIDGIVSGTGLPPARCSALLMEMEIKGMVRQRPGMYFTRGV
ncbi:MAG: DNA-protecting protein DprA [Deltaproteobacteria bacterium]|nr:DNA-protecting protein DprA [Deltaproteobacteria bacterium]